MVDETTVTEETTETTEEVETPEVTKETEERTTERTEEKEKVTPDDDWKSKSRKNESRAKKAEKELADLRKQVGEFQSANQTEQEKAIEKARKDALEEATSEHTKERRADRLEVAATRLAAKGIEIDEDETVRFADPEDALVHVERAIRSGDIDEDDIYDEDNRVKQDGLRDALVDILTRKPHLAAKPQSSEPPKPKGGSDAGRGSGASKELEEMTPDDHLKQIQGR